MNVSVLANVASGILVMKQPLILPTATARLIPRLNLRAVTPHFPQLTLPVVICAWRRETLKLVTVFYVRFVLCDVLILTPV